MSNGGDLITDAEYKLYIAKLARELSDEEFTKLVLRFDRIHACIAELLDLLNPVLMAAGLAPIEPEARVQGLCEICAKPCSDAKEQTVVCAKHSEYVADKCPKCIYWDVEICTLNGKCLQATEYEPRQPMEKIDV